jgi:hypothetical protein
MVKYKSGAGVWKFYLLGYMAWVFNKIPNMYKPVSSRVFDNHTFGTKQVFKKYTWYKSGF